MTRKIILAQRLLADRTIISIIVILGFTAYVFYRRTSIRVKKDKIRKSIKINNYEIDTVDICKSMV